MELLDNPVRTYAWGSRTVIADLLGEPVPVNGRIKTSALDKPGFGVELNRDIALHRPYAR